ncbi:MAG: PEP/pyruvate-binding domain-containing protein [Candidatus Uhrbacteria bacterium]|nr:PEP/pyruvate-binding domain-containing protein [Candidatus Uhrbacteria bacterium]
MKLTYPVSNLTKDDVAIAGGKGASLGEMTKAGISVPDGFIIIAGAFDQFLVSANISAEIESVLSSVDTTQVHTVDDASEKIRSLILNVAMPNDLIDEIKNEFNKLNAEFVAVRSSATAEDSATAAWAGQLETYLNATSEDLITNVQRCWASLFTPRAIFYRAEQGLSQEQVSVAVVVQKMIDSEISGVAFSVHPVTENVNQIIIEASYGLGEAVVSGQVTPDSYVVSKSDFKIVSKSVHVQDRALVRSVIGGNEWQKISGYKGNAQVLSDLQIAEVANTVIEIENHYGFPVDIEWTYAEDKLYILQSRPITTLSRLKPAVILSKQYTREHTMFYFDVWSKSNVYDSNESWHLPVNYSVFVREPGSMKTTAWYDMTEPFPSMITEQIEKDPSYFPRLVSCFKETWEYLLPYIEGNKEIRSLEELKKYYETWIRWWSPMVILLLIPDIKTISQELKHEALRIREEYQDFSEEGENPFTIFFRREYPEHIDIIDVILPEEVLRIESLTADEVIQIKLRKNGVALINDKIFLEEDISAGINSLGLQFESLEFDGKVLFGTVAQEGVARGIVRRVLYKDQIGEFKEGEILVAEGTTPDFVPAMKKAVAIVTDEGGITCHAAIVARELGKPCIVGTKVATQVLKDGMEVEVDANSGFVRILSQEFDREYVAYIQSQDWFLGFRAEESLFFFSAKFEGQRKFTEIEYGLSFVETILAPKSKDYPVRVFNKTQAEEFHAESERRVMDDPAILMHFLTEDEQLWLEISGQCKDLLRYVASKDEEGCVETFKLILGNYERYGFHFFVIFSLGMKLAENKDSVDEVARQILKKHDLWRNHIAFEEDRLGECLFEFLSFLVSARKLYVKPVDLMKYLTNIEIINLVDDKMSAKEVQDIIDRRRSGGFVFLGLREINQHVIDDAAEIAEVTNFMSYFEKEASELINSKTLKGEVAYRSDEVIRGQVVVVNETDIKFGDIDLAGKILVAIQTRPQLVPFMKGVKAIITDEGGVTSHAAIIAREMKIPAVIGTKVATQVLKDGMEVEVNFKSGEVRIVN